MAGTNGFRLMPTDDFHDAPATAVVTSAAGGNVVVVTYTWSHPEDGPQDGVLLVGSPDDEQVVSAAWGDSWHQKPSILTLAGTLAGDRLEVTADYGGGWQWTISLEGDGSDPPDDAQRRPRRTRNRGDRRRSLSGHGLRVAP